VIVWFIRVRTDVISPSVWRNGSLNAVRRIRLVWIAASAYRAWPPGSQVFQLPTALSSIRKSQAAVPAQPSFIRRPVLNLERHLWATEHAKDGMMAAIGVVFVRHGGKDPGEPDTTTRRKECTNVQPCSTLHASSIQILSCS
jgi:hypothetical protein